MLRVNSLSGFGRRASGVVAYDADAQAFFTAASITDTTQKNAVNQLVSDLKAAGIWTKMQALYPFVGGTADKHKYNLKDPQDTDAAFRIVWSGGLTHSSTGTLPNGSTGYANTKYNYATSGSLNNQHISFYSRTSTAAGDKCDMGAQNTGSPFAGMRLYARTSDNFNATAHHGATSPQTVANTNSAGLFIVSRTASGEYRMSVRNSSTTKTVASTTLISQPVYLFTMSWGGTPLSYSDRECAFASIGQGLTAVEAGDLHTAVNTFQTTLGRNV